MHARTQHLGTISPAPQFIEYHDHDHLEMPLALQLSHHEANTAAFPFHGLD